MALTFHRATKEKSKLRMAIDGPSGSGKTYTGLLFAFRLAGEKGRVAVIDTERGSASKYSDEFPPFDVLELETFNPAVYTDAIHAAEAAGYDVLLIDSLSHAWEGEDGALEMLDKIKTRMRDNSYTAWKDVTPVHRKMVDAILQADMHVIVTMRAKTDYQLVSDERGKMVPRKVGLAPIQRPGMEYEFDVACNMDWEHVLVVSKTRCKAVDGAVERHPTAEWLDPVIAWCTAGKDPEPDYPAMWRKKQQWVLDQLAALQIDAKGAQAALGVKSLLDYPGTPEEGIAALKESLENSKN
jgi:hypothetical protein